MTIQIEQRLNRCTRCGKMLHASAEVIVGEGEGRQCPLFCSERCHAEFTAMAAAEQRAGGAGSEVA